MFSLWFADVWSPLVDSGQVLHVLRIRGLAIMRRRAFVGPSSGGRWPAAGRARVRRSSFRSWRSTSLTDTRHWRSVARIMVANTSVIVDLSWLNRPTTLVRLALLDEGPLGRCGPASGAGPGPGDRQQRVQVSFEAADRGGELAPVDRLVPGRLPGGVQGGGVADSHRRLPRSGSTVGRGSKSGSSATPRRRPRD